MSVAKRWFPIVVCVLLACHSGKADPGRVKSAATGSARADDDEGRRTDPESARTPRQQPVPVLLVPLGRVPAKLLGAVADGLAEGLGVVVERHKALRLPRRAFYRPRRRYRADRLLDFLRKKFAGRSAKTRVLGLTTVDISTTKGRYFDWGVFGLGELGGRSCVISTYRLKRRARGRRHLRFRVVTTAIHEVGHTLGLDHCTEPRCVMLDAHGSIANTDSSTGKLGSQCRARLRRLASVAGSSQRPTGRPAGLGDRQSQRRFAP